MGDYADTMRKIDKLASGDDYFKAVCELTNLAYDLASELFKLKMTVEIKEEVIRDLTTTRKWWRELNIPNPRLADEFEEGMRL